MPQYDLARVEAQLRHLADTLAEFQEDSRGLEAEETSALLSTIGPPRARNVVGQVLRALEGRLGEGEGVRVLITGVHRGPGGHTTTWYEAFSDEDIPKALGSPGLARSLVLVANGERLRLLSALVSGACGSAEAMDRSGLSQGQFYHHLRSLEAAGMVRKVARDQHEPTVHGTSTLFTLLAAADYIAGKTPVAGEDAE
ncbi:MAG: winged helix-turn-helix domain-containing protein [bacterium]|nr:winged helix-turn-helix domain-containing protein [bacterium]